MTATAPRLARAELAETLHDSGYTLVEVAEMLGLAYSSLRSLLNDPDGAKQRVRRERYRGTCEECGAATDGSNGREAAPSICARCAAIRQHAERLWTRDRVLVALAEVNSVCVETLGRPIRAADWLSRYDSQTSKFSEARLVESDRLWAAIRERGLAPLVHLSIIQRELGGLDEAKRILGIDDETARPGGTPTHRGVQAVVHEPSTFRPGRHPAASDPDEVCPSCGEYVRVLDAATGWCRACVAAT